MSLPHQKLNSGMQKDTLKAIALSFAVGLATSVVLTALVILIAH